MSTISFKGRHFQHDMILQSMRWYLAYALSYRDIEEMMAERGREWYERICPTNAVCGVTH